MMKTPKSIKVGFRTYKIIPYGPIRDPKYHGSCDYVKSEIELARGLGDDEKKVTLFHEYFHAAMYDVGFSTNIPLKKEEELCQFFSSCVMELAKRNWKVLEWAHENSSRTSSLPLSCKFSSDESI